MDMTRTGVEAPPQPRQRTSSSKVLKAYHTTTEVARMLGVSRQTVLRMVHAERVRTCQTPGGFHRIPADEVSRLLAERGLAESPLTMARPVNILIVDDQEDVLDLLRRALKPAGERLHIRTATSGIDALIEIGEAQPDLLILDLIMPGVDGFEVCHRIRERYGSQLRIIAMSGQYTALTQAELDAHGLDAFFPKPIPLVEVLDTIGRLTGPAK